MTGYSPRDKKVQFVLVIEGMANLLVMFAKLVVELWIESLAIVGDAIHSLLDVTSNIVALAVMRFQLYLLIVNIPMASVSLKLLLYIFWRRYLTWCSLIRSAYFCIPRFSSSSIKIG